MRFLVDQNRSPSLAAALHAAGHDAVHVLDIGLESASDPAVFELAIGQQRVIVSADTDFSDLLAASGASRPSVVLFRTHGYRRAGEQAALLLANLSNVADELERGAIVVLHDDRVRVRRLPLGSEPPSDAT